jgi:hypothetical protein
VSDVQTELVKLELLAVAWTNVGLQNSNGPTIQPWARPHDLLKLDETTGIELEFRTGVEYNIGSKSIGVHRSYNIWHPELWRIWSYKRTKKLP